MNPPFNSTSLQLVHYLREFLKLPQYYPKTLQNFIFYFYHASNKATFMFVLHISRSTSSPIFG